MTTDMYDAQASSIKIEDIAASENNRVILERIRRNNAEDCNNDALYIVRNHDEVEDNTDYCPEGAKDMGWLGYFIGKHNHLKELHLRGFETVSGLSFAEVLEPFLMGVNRNKSLSTLKVNGLDLLDGMIFTKMGQFFKDNNSLVSFSMQECNFRAEGSRALSLALGSCKNSLTDVTLLGSNISDEGLVDIITSLSMHPNLRYLDLDGNRLRTNGCRALATLLQHSATELRDLDLRSNELDDDSIHSLVSGLKSCNHLQTIILLGNLSITKRGWQHLASVLKTPNSNLETLRIEKNNVDDVAVAEFARSLVNNYKLTTLNIQSNASITDEGWKAFSKLLCDTSSVNSTFLSNHTLNYLGDGLANEKLGSLLDLNGREDKKEVAIIKILQHHDGFDMMPFFEWEFKVLPLMINWLERASTIRRTLSLILVQGNSHPSTNLFELCQICT